jgi:hypothetical protein
MMGIAIVFWLICGGLAAMIASEKGGSAGLGFVLGALLGPFGVAFAFFMGSEAAKDQKSVATGQSRECPACTEIVKAGAVVCRYCRADLVPIAPKVPRDTE